MKNLMIPALALFLSAAAQADDSPLWMRYCAISPDGQTIAFFLPRGYLHGPFFRRESPAVDNTSGS